MQKILSGYLGAIWPVKTVLLSSIGVCIFPLCRSSRYHGLWRTAFKTCDFVVTWIENNVIFFSYMKYIYNLLCRYKCSQFPKRMRGGKAETLWAPLPFQSSSFSSLLPSASHHIVLSHVIATPVGKLHIFLLGTVICVALMWENPIISSLACWNSPCQSPGRRYPCMQRFWGQEKLLWPSHLNSWV